MEHYKFVLPQLERSGQIWEERAKNFTLEFDLHQA